MKPAVHFLLSHGIAVLFIAAPAEQAALIVPSAPMLLPIGSLDSQPPTIHMSKAVVASFDNLHKRKSISLPNQYLVRRRVWHSECFSE